MIKDKPELKTVALVTLQDKTNVGNRLQNYALQSVLENYGCTVYNLDNGFGDPVKPTATDMAKMQAKHLLGTFGNEGYRQQYLAHKTIPLRRNRIAQFNNAYIHNPIVITWEGRIVQTNGLESPLCSLDNIDLGIVGSDQVWHGWKTDKLPIERELSYFYLSFLAPHKRAAYAASFGFDEFPPSHKHVHAWGLNGIRYISCREQSGCNLVKELVAKDVPHVLDPTLLLNADDWRQLATKSSDSSKEMRIDNYVFTYFLGQVTKEYKEAIRTIAKGKKIINFMDYGNRRMMAYGPIEFLSFIEHADYVLTDSFHCVAFCILFDTEFVSFKRQETGFTNMFGRIEELLCATHKEGCAYNEIAGRHQCADLQSQKRESLEYIELILGANSQITTLPYEEASCTVSSR